MLMPASLAAATNPLYVYIFIYPMHPDRARTLIRTPNRAHAIETAKLPAGCVHNSVFRNRPCS